jgi:mannose-6-phosphate isomerase-like protein (cupin superfamily)
MLPQKRAALTAFCRRKSGFGGANGGVAPRKAVVPETASVYGAVTLSSMSGIRAGNSVLGKTGRSVHPCRKNREVVMKRFIWGFAALLGVMLVASAQAQVKINPTDPQPTCNMCPGTVIPLSELEAYTKKAMAERLIDQQVRDIEIGKAHVGIGMVYRGKLDKPNADSVAEHDQVSEVYHIISGSATIVLGPDIVNRQRRPATLRTVVEFNGPGNNGSDIRNGVAHQIKAGDVLVIPAGTGHWFTQIDDHINYLMIRYDPDKVTPLRSEAQSKDYLSKPAPR